MEIASDEEILEPELEIVDSHHHLWPASPAQENGGTLLSKWAPYSLDDFCSDAKGHRITGSVYVECQACYRESGPESMRPVGETESVAALPAPGDICAGIVGFADLSLGTSVGDVLDAHHEVAGRRFRGIRHTVAWDRDPAVYATAGRPPPGLLEDSAFRAGAAELAARGLTFETWLYFHQLPELSRFAAACPELLIVLDHLGGPAATGRHAGVRDEVLKKWREGMAALSRHGNVVLKLGAVGMKAFSTPDLLGLAPATSQAIADYWGREIRFCIETFGADRCMFASNFPVDGALCSYASLWNAFKLIAAPYSQAERTLLFTGTARATYQLPAR